MAHIHVSPSSTIVLYFTGKIPLKAAMAGIVGASENASWGFLFGADSKVQQVRGVMVASNIEKVGQISFFSY